MATKTTVPAEQPAAEAPALPVDPAEVALDQIASFKYGSDSPRGHSDDVIDTLKRIAADALAALRANRA